MIPREIFQQSLADYEKVVEEIQGMGRWEAREYLGEKCMGSGLCYYLSIKFGVHYNTSTSVFGEKYLGGRSVTNTFLPCHETIPTLTRRLQLRINKLKELLNDNPLSLPK